MVTVIVFHCTIHTVIYINGEYAVPHSGAAVTPGPAVFGGPQLVGVENLLQFKPIHTTVQDSIRHR